MYTFCGAVYFFIYRYSGRLNLGGNQNKVNILATKITAQMNRDWIHTGRRPAGICAVALQIACNTYNITTVTRKDICRVLRICDATVTKRIREFEQTPAALMSKDDFLQQLPPKFDRVTGDQIERIEFDPPSFITNRIKDGTVDALLNNRADIKPDVKGARTAATDNSSSDDDDVNDSENSSTSKRRSIAAPVVGKGKGNARKHKLAAIKAAAAATTPTDSDDMSVDNATDDDDDDDSDTAQQQQQQQSVTKGSKKRKRATTTAAASGGSSSSSKAAATKSTVKGKGKGKASATATIKTSDQLSDLSDDELPQKLTRKAASKLRSSSKSKRSTKSNNSDAECSNDDDEDYVNNDSDTDSSSEDDDSDSDDSLSRTSNSKNKKQKKASKATAVKAEKGKKQTKKRRTKKTKKPKKVIPVYEDVDPSDAAATIQHAMIMRAQHAQYRQQGPKMIKRQDELQAVIDTTIEDMKNDLMMLEEQPIPEARDEFVLPPIEVEVKHDDDAADDDTKADDTKDDTNADGTANGTADGDKSAKGKQQQQQPEASDEVIEGELPDNDNNNSDNDDDNKHTIGSSSGGGGSSTTATSSSSKKKATKVTFSELNQYDDDNNTSKIEIATADGVPIVYVDMTVAEAYDEAAAVARLTAELKLPDDDTYSDIDDDDFMREHIIPKADSARKAIVWQEINKVYLAAQEEKVKLEKQQIANNGGTKPVKRSYKKQKLAASAAHAIEKLANEKKISNKINYEAIKSAFEPENSYSGAAASSSSSRSRHNSRNNNDNTNDSNAGGGNVDENPYQNYTEIYEDVDDEDYKAQMDRTQRGRAVFGKGDDSISVRSTHPAPVSTSASKANDDANSSCKSGGSSKGKGKANKSSASGGSSSSGTATAAVVKQLVPDDVNNDDNDDDADEEEEEEVQYEHFSEDDYDGEEYE
jgi:Brf1-like TBP-binding domain/Transcription factor TFIIB repeat